MTAYDPTQDPGFLAALQAAFQVEAAEHLQAMSSGLLAMEKTAEGARMPVLEAVYREAHSLKGAARAVNRTDLEMVCQRIEQVLSGWKRGETKPDAAGLEALIRDLDEANRMLQPAAEGAPETGPGLAVAVASPAAGTVRVATAKLDRMLMQAEQMLTAKMSATQRTGDLLALHAALDQWKSAWAGLRPDLRRASKGAEADPVQAFLEWNHAWVNTLESRIHSLAQAAARDQHLIGQSVDALREDTKALLMTPMALLLAPLPRVVHDLCRDEGKEADLIVRGEEVEIDKRILEEMKDPLIHLLRNCVDHGIEKPEQRVRSGKPRRGVITVATRQVENSRVEILVTDDGAGINLDGLKASAVRQGMVTADEAARMGRPDAFALLFESGVSTREVASTLSGRGLGMAIVREKCDKLGGRIEVQSQPGQGTEFRVVLPLTMATFRGLMVQASSQVFAIPLGPVERVGRIRRNDFGERGGGRMTTAAYGSAMPVVPLAGLLQLPAPLAETGEFVPLVVLRSAEHRVALAVDAVLHEEEVLVRRINGPLGGIRHVAAAAILGSGRVVPVLHPAQLVKTAMTWRAEGSAAAPAPRAASILVVEDSITSRMLLKGLLESAGYRVRTAVDGFDALTVLASTPFAAVVSDVEMPRLSGIDLTAQIRASEQTARLPVILVTALASAADRERGLAAGANAYLVKGRFEQSDLLETLRRLLP